MYQIKLVWTIWNKETYMRGRPIARMMAIYVDKGVYAHNYSFTVSNVHS